MTLMESSRDQTGVSNIPKFFDGISLNESHQLALVASNLTGKFWHGTVTVFNDASLAPNIPHVDFAAPYEGGCVDLCWIDSESIAVATDHGTVDVYKLKESRLLEHTLVLAEHNDICSTIDVSKRSRQLVSGSHDSTIKLWDLDVDLSINTLCIHTDTITDVAWSKHTDNVFVSTSQDGSVKLFDSRTKNATQCSVLLSSQGSFPLCVDWMDEVNLCVGFSDGRVGLLDTNTHKFTPHTSNTHTKAVNKVLHLQGSIVASASEDMSVQVQQLQDNTVLYTDSRHTDYVQDLTFSADESLLYSCGYDGNVFNHKLDFIGTNCT